MEYYIRLVRNSLFTICQQCTVFFFSLPTRLNHCSIFTVGQGVFNVTLSNGQTRKISHPFDGLGQVHRFEFLGASNTVRYNSRYTARGYEKRIERQDDTMITFGRDPCKTTLGRLQSFYHRLLSNHVAERKKMHEEDPSSENINVTVTPNFPLPKEMTDDKLVVVVKTDANMLQLIDAETLGKLDFLLYFLSLIYL